VQTSSETCRNHRALKGDIMGLREEKVNSTASCGILRRVRSVGSEQKLSST